MQAAEILNFENYCALAVSLCSKRLICPELAFQRLGVNCFLDKKDQERFAYTLYGPKFWLEMKALRDDGWRWAEIADYFGITYSTAMTVYCRSRRRYTGVCRRERK